MRLVFFGTYDATRHPRVRVLQEGLAAHGDEVVECNVPLALDTSARVRALRRPWLLPLLGVRLAVAWTRLWRRSRGLPPADAVVVGYMGHFDVHLGRRLWRRTPIVLDHLVSAADTATDRRVSSRGLVSALARLDAAALSAADLVCVDTEAHLALLPDRTRDRGVVVPVGAPEHWFSSPRELPGSPLRVVFFGLFTPLQGAPVIGEAIARLARAGEPVTFTMVGRGQDYEETVAAAGGSSTATWLDWVDAQALPGLVAGHHVCLGIFGTTPKAQNVVPNKVFQGAAAGTAIVTSDTPPQRSAFGDVAVLVPPGDPEALAAALASLAADPEQLAARRAASHRRAEEFRPLAVVEPLRGRLARAIR